MHQEGHGSDLQNDIPLHVLGDTPPGLYPTRTQIANVCFIAAGDSGEFVLVDAGVSPAGKRILEVAEERFGPAGKPLAIILTHGHFDHVGAVSTLLERWDVPVYAHPLELPYLTGESDYPPANPGAGGGLMSLLSPLYPRDPIHLGQHVQALPKDGSVPGLSDWRWLHTPGHTPGHVSFYREHDGALIAGDAFTTVKQESLLAVLTQHAEVHGPPAYFTTDWDAAWNSVRLLAMLHPAWAITGHGLAMSGASLQEGLIDLAARFDELAMPDEERFLQ
ncbi:metallo-beta-lactamase [Alicyclobacillus ferrooxydans]|uniref:Metallo-beta-lactamase n=2 Tax=Alicyclobacillus ferrooxydans TaxID=471514 RepID=A0A0P9CHS1_9BACL|nr:MBL fold metallo-hydrolase [Alicyclobacillus ferrooxydans]KPV45035.1 metallo-beta-lactamase [Alicyclobacillus ferrooxydans]